LDELRSIRAELVEDCAREIEGFKLDNEVFNLTTQQWREKNEQVVLTKNDEAEDGESKGGGESRSNEDDQCSERGELAKTSTTSAAENKGKEPLTSLQSQTPPSFSFSPPESSSPPSASYVSARTSPKSTKTSTIDSDDRPEYPSSPTDSSSLNLPSSVICTSTLLIKSQISQLLEKYDKTTQLFPSLRALSEYSPAFASAHLVNSMDALICWVHLQNWAEERMAYLEWWTQKKENIQSWPENLEKCHCEDPALVLEVLQKSSVLTNVLSQYLTFMPKVRWLHSLIVAFDVPLLKNLRCHFAD
jgi:hypothetical protein